MHARSLRVLTFAGALVTITLAIASPLGAAERNAYLVTNLVSNSAAVPAATHDASLVNAWGLTSSSSSPWWVADNGANVSTLYNGNTGAKLALTVTVPGGPTGTVFNIAGVAFPTAFPVPGGASSRFLFASEDGKIRGWPGSGTVAQETAAHSSVSGAIYKGLAIAVTPDGPRLYATDFHNGRVDVWDGSWNLVTSATFTDPALPAGYAPFGIQRSGDRIFVTYAKQDADAADELHGQGLGFVDAYDTAGNLLARVAQHGQLNAPWGLAVAPASFGRFGGDLLVGNFGDGEINAYAALPNGHFEHRGELRGTDGKPIAIEGLWALEFGNDAAAGPSTRLFFTAGPNDEADGLFGSIDPN
jgi:uncharacterized protein (TIGR03118 family)